MQKEIMDEEKNKKEILAERIPVPNYAEKPEEALDCFIECFRKHQKPDLFPAELGPIYYKAKKNGVLRKDYLDEFLDVLLNYENPDADWYQFSELVCLYARHANGDGHFDEKIERLRQKAEGTITGTITTEKFLKERLLQSLC